MADPQTPNTPAPDQGLSLTLHTPQFRENNTEAATINSTAGSGAPSATSGSLAAQPPPPVEPTSPATDSGQGPGDAAGSTDSDTPVTPASTDPDATVATLTGDTPPGPPNEDKSAVSGVLGYAKDIGRGLFQGAISGVADTFQTVDHGATALTKIVKSLGVPDVEISVDQGGVHFTKDTNPSRDASEGQIDDAVHAADNLMPPETVLGHVAEGVTQFATGMALFGGVAGVNGLTAELGGKAALEITKGTLSNALSFDSKDGNLADIMQRYPSLSNPISQYLMSDPNDSEGEARFKKAIEGGLLGAFGEVIFNSVKTFKALKAGNVPAAAEASKATQESVAKASTPKPPKAPEEFNVDETGQGATPVVPKHGPDGTQAEYRVQEPEEAHKPVEAPYMDDSKIDEYRQKLARNSDWMSQGGVAPESVQFNSKKFPTRGDVKSAISAMEEVHSSTHGAMDQTRTLEAAKQVADMIGAKTPDFLTAMAQTARDITRLDSRILAYRDAFIAQGAKVDQLAAMVVENNPGELRDAEELLSRFETEVRVMNEMRVHYKTITTETSRALGGMRNAAVDVKEYMGGIGDTESLHRLAEALVSRPDPSPAGASKILDATISGKFIGKLNSLLVNSLLGLPTATVKLTSDVMHLIVTPAEHALSGGYQAVAGGAWGVARDGMKGAANGAAPGIAKFKEGMGYYAAYASGTFDALKMAGRAFKLGGQITDRAQGHTVSASFGDGTVLNSLRTGNQTAAVLNSLSNTATLPTRIIGSVDEFTKHLTYRAEVARKAYRDVAADATRSAEQKAGYVQMKMRDAFAPDGSATDKAALRFAQEQTFTQAPLKDPAKLELGMSRSATGIAMQVAKDAPILRQFMPFIKVVGNIGRWQWTRTPGINLLQRELRQDLMAGGERTADAAAKMTTGAAIVAAGVMMANAGLITGTLSPDEGVQRRMEDLSGIKHSSFVIKHPDGSRDFIPMAQMADPIGPMLALSADLAAAYKHMPEGQYAEMAGGLVTAVMHSYEDKRYLQGITNAYQAFAGTLDPSLTSGERGKLFLAQMLAGFVPNMLSNHNQGDDPYVREVRGLMDGVLRKLPGSVGVDPHRNDLGEPVMHMTPVGPGDLSPYQKSHEDDSVVSQELSRQLGMSNRPPPKMPTTIGFGDTKKDIDLKQVPGPEGYTAYDRVQQLMASPPGHPTLRQAFEKLMAPGSKYWTAGTNDMGQYDGSRRDMIDKVYGGYQKTAQALLMQENPTLQSLARAHAMNSAAVKAGKPLPYAGLLNSSFFKDAVTQQ